MIKNLLFFIKKNSKKCVRGYGVQVVEPLAPTLYTFIHLRDKNVTSE
jgi:hypothetical protein